MIAQILGYYEIDNANSSYKFTRDNSINYFDINPQNRMLEVTSKEIETSCRDWSIVEGLVADITKEAIKRVRESYAEVFRIYIELACGDEFAKFNAMAYKGNKL